jgi:hypothetical protein
MLRPSVVCFCFIYDVLSSSDRKRIAQKFHEKFYVSCDVNKDLYNHKLMRAKEAKETSSEIEEERKELEK